MLSLCRCSAAASALLGCCDDDVGDDVVYLSVFAFMIVSPSPSTRNAPCAFGCCLRRRFCLNIFIHSACLHIDTHKHVDTFVFIYDTRDGPDERIAHRRREREREREGLARRRGAPKHKNKFLLSCARLACCFAGLLLLSSFSFCFTVSSDCFCFSFSCFLTAVVVVAVLLAAAAAAIAAALSIVVTLLFLFI